MDKREISKIILIAIGWLLLNFGLVLLATKIADNYSKQKGLDKCYCKYDIYLPTDVCWKVCN